MKTHQFHLIKTKNNAFFCVSVSLVLIIFSQSGLAQTLPNTGTLLKQIEGVKPMDVKNAKPVLISVKPGDTGQGKNQNKELKIKVSRFTFVGNTLIGSEQLSQLTAPLTGRTVAFSELQEINNTIAAAYAKGGWLARVYLPGQDVTNGIIVIRIVEAQLGKVVISGDSKRAPLALVKATIEASTNAGAALNTKALDNAIIQASRIPGVVMSGGLVAGAAEQQTDLSLSISDAPLWSGSTAIDNLGSRMTGPSRASAHIALASPLALGDMAGVNFIKSKGSDYLRFSYSLPINSKGWRAGVNTSYLSYQVVAPEFLPLDISGQAKTVGLESVFPLIVSRGRDIFLNISADQKAFQNYTSTTTSSAYSSLATSVALRVRTSDAWLGAGSNNASIRLTYGRLDYGKQNDAGEDLLIPLSYTKINLALLREQLISEKFSIAWAYSMQIANQNLDSSEKFYLGGSSGVRAYPSSEGGGSSGRLLSIDARFRVNPQLTLGAFYDWGDVTVNAKNDALSIASPVTLNKYALQGAGLNISYALGLRSRLTATWARRLETSPIKNITTGYDSDGSLSLNRFWLSANLEF